MPATPPPQIPRVTTTKPTLATTVTAALGVSVAAVAAALAVGLAVGLPIALQRFRAAGGGAGHEADPAPVVRLRYADRDDAALGLVNIGADKGVFNAIEQTADGGLILVGSAQRVGRTDSDILVVKAKITGAVEWVRYYNPSNGEYDTAAAVQQTDDDGDGQPDDGYAVAGTSSFDDKSKSAMLLLKLDANGQPDQTWEENPVRYAIAAVSARDEAYAVVQTTDGSGAPNGYVMVGKTSYFNGEVFVSDVGVVRTDRLGQPDLRWHDAQVPYRPLIFGTEAAFEVGYGVQPSGDGFLIVGRSGDTGGANPHPLILHIGPDGKQQQLTVRDESGEARTIAPTYDHDGQGRSPTGFIVAGSLYQNIEPYGEAFLLKLTARGSPDATWLVNPRTYGGSSNDWANGAVQLFDPDTGAASGYLAAGYSTSQDPDFQTDGQADVYVVRADSNGARISQYLPHRTGADWATAIATLVGSSSAFATVGMSTITDPDPEAEIRLVPELILYPGGSGPKPEPAFRRGDSDGNGTVNLTDVVFTLNALFKGGPQPACPDAADADDNGVVNLSDGAFTLNYLFKGSGLPPPPPGPESRGPDPTPDDLDACAYTAP